MSKIDEVKKKLKKNIDELIDTISKYLRDFFNSRNMRYIDWEWSTYGTISDFWLIIIAEDKEAKVHRYKFGFRQPEVEEIEGFIEGYGLTLDDLEKDPELADLVWHVLILERIADFVSEDLWQFEDISGFESKW
ncbi:MAG TPA: hypothetical protein ENG16_01680 [Archaeoglobus sp.]|nr:hypothetical protein [Archaeoglobus sp.]